MKKTLFLLLSALLMVAGISHAHDLEPLHVDGRYLKNPQGDIVTLHGWIGDWIDLYHLGNDNASGFTAWKLTVDSILAAGYKLDYARMSCGDVSARSIDDFDNHVLPKIDYLNSKGIYVLLFPDVDDDNGYTRRIGELRQQRLLMWFDYLSSHPHIKNNPGVMFALDCEPGLFLGSDGSEDNFKTLKDYYQPMVDLIRSNGSDNVIWVSGTGYQNGYDGYAVYPIEGENIGYDIHYYCFTELDTHYDTLRERWAKEVEMASNMAPIILTETAWYGKENEWGRTSTFGVSLKRLCDETGNVSWNLYSEGNLMARVNQPSPDGQSTNYNSPEACYVPFLQWTKEYAATKYTPASELRAERVELEHTYTTVYPGDTRPIALMATFANGRRWNVAGDAVWTSSDESVITVRQGNMHVMKEGTATLHGEYTDGTGQVLSAEFTVTSSLFPLSADGIINNLFFLDGTYDEKTHIFHGFGCGWYYTFSANIRVGMPAWNYYGGLDFSAYRYLVIRLDDAVFLQDDISFNHGSVWINSTAKEGPEAEAIIDMEGKTELVIDLHAYPALDLSHIVSVRIHGGDDQGSCIKEIFLSNDGVNPATEPFTLNTTAKASDIVMFYGDDVPTLTYEVTGPGTVSEPTLTTTATKTSPVGTYDILISGSQDGVTYKPGCLTILPAPLTITANDMAVGVGMDIPALTVTYDGFRNGDTEGTALSELPTVSTTTTKDSPVGNYTITVSDGQAENYLIGDFVQSPGNGTLTITPDLNIALPADRTDHVTTSQEDWHAWGVCSTEYAPAVTTADGRTAQMVECYEETVGTMGTMMEQTVTGLEDGNYTLVLCANAYYTDGRGFDSDLTEGATDVVCLHANDVTMPITAHIGTATAKNDEYTLEVTVTAGTLHISMEKLKAGTNWHTLQIKSLTLTKIPSLDEAYVKALAEAEELLSQKMSVYARNTLQQIMATEHTYANYYRLTEAMQQARTNIECNAFAARALEVTKNELLMATNVCTPVAESWYRQSYAAFKKLYDEDLVTDAVAGNYYNPYEGGFGESYDDFKRFLMSAWEFNMENTHYLEGAPYNASMASAANESGFNNPYIFYNAPEGSPTLEARTLTAIMTNMEPGEYTLSAFVRLIAVDGNVAPKGITMQLCDGTPVPLSGERFRDWDEYLGHYTAKGTVGDDGVLTVRFIVAADNNVRQLAFRDLWIDNGTAVKANDLTMTYGDAVPELTYTASGDLAGGVPELSTTATSASPVGTYPITVKPGTVGNRFVRYTDGTLTIQPAPLTITADNKTKKQGDAMPELTATYKGFKNGETHEVLTKRPTLSCTATAASAPGTYPITVQGATAQNYDITFVSGTLTVTEADAVIVTANSYTIAYGDALPEFGYTVEGTELDGKPRITCTAKQDSPVGTYDIVITKGSVKNYNVTYVNGTLTITKAPLTITADDKTKKQGDAMPELTATYKGFKNGETREVLTTQPTLNCTATAESAPGTYPITVQGATAQNYDITFVGGTLTIEASPLPLDEDLTARVGTAQGDWHAWGVCATDYAPAVTTNDGRRAQMMETYEENVETTGEMMYQTISGLDNGDYAVELYANAQYTDGRGFASDLKDGATNVVYVSANDRRCYVTAHVGTAVSENGVYTVYAHVTDGTLRIGLTAEKAGTNWHTLQIKKLTLLRQGTVVYADDKTREANRAAPTRS